MIWQHFLKNFSNWCLSTLLSCNWLEKFLPSLSVSSKSFHEIGRKNVYSPGYCFVLTSQVRWLLAGLMKLWQSIMPVINKVHWGIFLWHKLTNLSNAVSIVSNIKVPKQYRLVVVWDIIYFTIDILAFETLFTL